MTTETSSENRLFELICELLDEGLSARDIRSITTDAIHEWRMQRSALAAGRIVRSETKA